MRLTRVLLPTPLVQHQEHVLDETASTHLLRAMRLRAGDALIVFDGKGYEADAVLLGQERNQARIQLHAVRHLTNESPLRITLLQGVARGEKMDLILQKATELGTAEFFPVFTERSEVKLSGERAAKRHAHWQAVVASACGQSGRATLPAVHAPQLLARAFALLPIQGARLMLDPQATATCATAIAAGITQVTLAIGPEGGFSKQDHHLLHTAGFTGLRLGPRILRTETAGIAALAALQALHGDMV